MSKGSRLLYVNGEALPLAEHDRVGAHRSLPAHAFHAASRGGRTKVRRTTAAGQARLGEAQARGLPDGRREIEWRMTASGLAALGAFLLLAVVLIALASGGGGDDRGGLPDAAPAEAPLSRQLDALERQVQEADGR